MATETACVKLHPFANCEIVKSLGQLVLMDVAPSPPGACATRVSGARRTVATHSDSHGISVQPSQEVGHRFHHCCITQIDCVQPLLMAGVV